MDDDDVIPHLTCDIELEFVGPNDAVLNSWAAATLRKLAERIEKGEFDDGHHSVTDSTGKAVGTIYIDYSGELA